MNRRRRKHIPLHGLHGDVVDHHHRVTVVSDDMWRDDESLSLDDSITNIPSRNESRRCIPNYTSATRYQDLHSTRGQPESSMTSHNNRLHLGTETDDDSLRRILGGPYRSTREGKGGNPSTIPLKYSIPEDNDYENKGNFRRLQHLRNTLNRIKSKGQRKKGLDASWTHRFFLKCKAIGFIRRKENAYVPDDFSEETKSTSLRVGGIPDCVVTSLRSSGDLGSQPTRGSAIFRKFRRLKLRKTEEPTKEWLDIWSEISSLGGSYDAGYGAMDFDDRTIMSDESGSLFDSFIDALDDFASLRFLSDGYQCGIYEIPSVDMKKCTLCDGSHGSI